MTDRPPETSPRRNVHLETLVIGDGILGRWTAAELIRRAPERRVALVAPSGSPGGASRAAGAMLGCFGEVTTETLATPEGEERFALSLAAHRMWPDELERLREDAQRAGEELHHVPDTFVLLNSCGSAMDSENLAALLRALDRFDEPYEEVDPTGLPGLRPRPDARPLRALHLPAEGGVDGRQVLRLVGQRADRAGVATITSEVARIAPREGVGFDVTTTDGRVLVAEQVVVAAGASSGRLLATALGDHAVMPVLAGAGQAVVARRVTGEPFASVVRTTNRSGACGLHVLPLQGDHEYVGATNVLFAEPELHTYLGVGHFVVDCAVRQLDEQIFLHRVDEWRMGNRPVALDGFPLVGWTQSPGLYVLTGTYRDGFHAAPALAAHAADQLLGGAGTLDLDTFAPERRPIANGTVEEAVDEYVRHLEAGWFEAGASQPMHTSTPELTAHFAREAAELYRERLHSDVPLAPDVLMFLLASRKAESDVDRIAAYLATL
jgi:glycine oxidase